MLIALRWPCRLRMYMPKKPAKYGIKFMATTDAFHTFPIQCKYLFRNVTADLFSSVQLVNELRKKCSTYVQLLIKYTLKIQRFPQHTVERKTFTLWVYHMWHICDVSHHMPLLSYVTKPKKAVNLISSMHLMYWSWER